jgi:hypothetical protein
LEIARNRQLLIPPPLAVTIEKRHQSLMKKILTLILTFITLNVIAQENPTDLAQPIVT